MVKEIYLRNIKKQIVKTVKVSDEDYEWLSEYKWHRNVKKGGMVYAQTTLKDTKKNQTMHRMILEKTIGPPPEDHVVDHIDHNTLNNCRDNLRYVKVSNNNQNKAKKDNATTKFVGVSFYKDRKKYVPACRGIKLGTYKTAEEAAKVYDIYVFQTFGKESKTNGMITYEEAMYVDLDTILPAKKKTTSRKEKQIDEEIARNENGVAIIKTKHLDVLVDDKMWHDLSKHSWRRDGNGYVITDISKDDGSKTTVAMHIFIMEPSKGLVVDHINNVKHDNRRSNLRISDESENNHNRKKAAGKSSKHVGVTKIGEEKWSAYIKKGFTKYCLGSYNGEDIAGTAYNIAAKILYKEKANLNEINTIIIGLSKLEVKIEEIIKMKL